ncbi:hypothetical protein HHI36_014019 [Cryptolaemus montrouzieri]|uniref:Lipid droplet-associated hydrolase n=1 Tax=Cryptolaemus montrouzieri TaxID=559131 RepID=A0ABD2N2C0_9CUCU
MKMMKQAFVNINNLPTRVITYGRWITDEPDKNEEIILIIPGNPGITDFYKVFMEMLYEKLRCPVWVVGHTGHEKHCSRIVPAPLPQPIGLREQIQQKVTFIEEYVPEDAKLHIIGHSIGSHMALEMLKEPTIESRIAQIYLIFPVFEKMLETPNGKRMYNYFSYLKSTGIFLARIHTILPKIITYSALKLLMSIRGIRGQEHKTLHRLIHPKMLQQVFYLVFEQLDQVKERDSENFKNNANRINILYGDKDNWCFEDSFVNIRKDFPEIRAEMTLFEHGFFFRENEEVADVLGEWIQSRLD